MESIPAALVMGGISKAYLEKTLEGLGALKGSPCYVKSFEYDTNYNTIITLAWIGTDGTEETSEVTIKRGLRGLKGDTGEKGDTGDDGVSVTGISKISEIGLAKTYRIALSNDTYFDFVVNDGMTPSLTNYYTKSQTEDLIAAIRTLSLEKVTELPTEDIDPLTIYLVRKADSDVDNDVFDEYLYIDEAWEHIGSTSVNLANYYTKTQTDALLDEKQDAIPSYSKEEYEEYEDDIPVGTIFNLEEDHVTGMGNGDVYSTDETRIGTWIDGKPLYRKAVLVNNPSTSHSLSINPNVWFPIDDLTIPSNIESLAKCDFYRSDSTDIDKFKSKMQLDGQFYYGVSSTGKLQVYLTASASTSVTYFVGVILEYTKTTD